MLKGAIWSGDLTEVKEQAVWVSEGGVLQGERTNAKDLGRASTETRWLEPGKQRKEERR